MKNLSRKQQLYLEILNRVLPLVRNIQRQSLWRRVRIGSLYPEAELAHNLPELLLEPALGKQDVWWLKYQGIQYRLAHARSSRPSGDSIIRFLDELENMIPAELQDEFKKNADTSDLSFLSS